jgi:hypothetical protein
LAIVVHINKMVCIIVRFLPLLFRCIAMTVAL